MYPSHCGVRMFDVLEDGQEHRGVEEVRDGLGAESHHHGQAETGEKGEADDVQRAEVEGAITVQTFGAVMHLMEGAPEPVDPVHGPVPDIDQQLIDQHADAGADKGVERLPG